MGIVHIYLEFLTSVEAVLKVGGDGGLCGVSSPSGAQLSRFRALHFHLCTMELKSHTHTHTHTLTQTHTHIHTHRLTQTHKHTHIHTHTYIHTQTHTDTHTHTCTHTYIHTHTHRLTQTHTHTHTYTLVYSCLLYPNSVVWFAKFYNKSTTKQLQLMKFLQSLVIHRDKRHTSIAGICTPIA